MAEDRLRLSTTITTLKQLEAPSLKFEHHSAKIHQKQKRLVNLVVVARIPLSRLLLETLAVIQEAYWKTSITKLLHPLAKANPTVKISFYPRFQSKKIKISKNIGIFCNGNANPTLPTGTLPTGALCTSSDQESSN